MNKILTKSIISALVLLFTIKVYAQYSTVDSLNKTYLNWYNLDPKTDHIQGVSTEKAYRKMKNITPVKKIIVAVIDGGVDTAHVDLKGKIWHNTKEIPNNGIDDDHNGYIDDIIGWNFIGNTKGENLTTDNYEYIRIVRKGNNIYKNVKSIEELPVAERKDYKIYLECKEKYEIELKKTQNEKSEIESTEKKMDDAENSLKKFLGKNTIEKTDFEKITTDNNDIINAKKTYLSLLDKGVHSKGWDAMKNRNKFKLEKYINPDFNARKIIGDNYEDISDRNYGNPNVNVPGGDHGTMVSGFIAGIRGNEIGIEGIAENVEIMAIRVVPDGDEYDKDVALGIRYAVDNGANIINMSFGKAYSPQKKFVDDAIKYASEHNVLLVHAAGNDGSNNDIVEHYPSQKFDDGTTSISMLNVGASTTSLDQNFPAYFSNYGQSVDLFAPGFKMVCLLPGNKYTIASGTSFSCPVVSGVAALVWSYYPTLTAAQLKNILLKSVVKHSKLKVKCPNKEVSGEVVPFSKLCQTAGLVNAYNALKLAKKVTKKN